MAIRIVITDSNNNNEKIFMYGFDLGCTSKFFHEVLTGSELEQLELLSWHTPRLLPASTARKKLAAELLPAAKVSQITLEMHCGSRGAAF